MSTIQLKFFARLREELQTDQLSVPADEVSSLTALKAWLIDQHPDWRGSLDGPLMQAVNQEMVQGDQPLKAGDEVALFPPVTGG